MNHHPLPPIVQVPAAPLSLESEGGREAIKINLSQSVHADLDSYVRRTGETKSDVIANSLKFYLNANPSWMYRRYFIEPKDRKFDIEDLNHVSQVSQVFLVCTSHPNADYREYICAQVVNSAGKNEDDLITIKPLFYLPHIYGEELTLKSEMILPQVFSASPLAQVFSTDLRYEVSKKYVWSTNFNVG